MDTAFPVLLNGAGPATARRKALLCVEGPIRAVLSQFLEANGYDIVPESPRCADLARTGSFDLVVIADGALGNGHLVPEIAAEAPEPLRQAMSLYERGHIEAALRRHGYDKSATARALQIGVSSLYRKLDELGIPKSQPGEGRVPAAQ